MQSLFCCAILIVNQIGVYRGEDYGKQHYAQCDDPEGHDRRIFFRSDRYVRTRDENIFKGTEDARDMRGSPAFVSKEGRFISQNVLKATEDLLNAMSPVPKEGRLINAYNSVLFYLFPEKKVFFDDSDQIS